MSAILGYIIVYELREHKTKHKTTLPALVDVQEHNNQKLAKSGYSLSSNP
jgi:hypothetical protein